MPTKSKVDDSRKEVTSKKEDAPTELPPNHYVDNKRLLELVKEYKARKAVDPNARISEEAGSMIILLATRAAQHRYFRNYTFKDEMIEDGILKLVEAFGKFDTEKFSNPFGYFSQCLKWTYSQRKKLEKKQRDVIANLRKRDPLFDVMEQDSDTFSNENVYGDFMNE